MSVCRYSPLHLPPPGCVCTEFSSGDVIIRGLFSPVLLLSHISLVAHLFLDDYEETVNHHPSDFSK